MSIPLAAGTLDDFTELARAPRRRGPSSSSTRLQTG
jgi:hypothetical protein